jgi:hypothetical protein
VRPLLPRLVANGGCLEQPGFWRERAHVFVEIGFRVDRGLSRAAERLAVSALSY